MKTTAPITVAEAVRRVRSSKFVLPGIQRSFVWEPRQICDLFDSLMRGYPIGSLIVWRTRPSDHKQLPWRKLVTDYYGRTTELAKARPPSTAMVDAVLDGQQRLTALNIGVAGSHAASEERAVRRLYLDLDFINDDAGPDERAYGFELLSEANVDRGERAWFLVGDAFELRRDGIRNALLAADLDPTRARQTALRHLVKTLNHEPVLNSAIETAKDLDRVLNVFARINKGGTQLTYVDLLVSTATARWRTLDAGVVLRELRDDLNKVGIRRNGEGFRITTDRIVKAGLVLLDADTPKFHVESFLTGNRAQTFEKRWPDFSRAMETAMATFASFGISARTLGGQNAIIPVAYYAWRRKLRPSYATAHMYERDRRLVRAFVARTLLQRGYWTGAVDPVLVIARDAIRKEGAKGFPLQEIEDGLSMAKPILVTPQLVSELVELPYSDRRTLTLLRLLFPNVAVEKRLDKDHVFPSAKINAHQLSLAGLHTSELGRIAALADRLPNLQLVDEADNIHKKDQLPKAWFNGLTATSKRKYTQQDVRYLPADLGGCEEFWAKRRVRLESRIGALLNGTAQ